MNGIQVAYLISEYPAVSHTFVEREIAAVRAAGVGVQTFTVRRSPAAQQLSAAARAEAESTTALQSGRRITDVRAVARFAARHPLPFARGVTTALTTGGRGLRLRIKQLFYLAEAAILVGHLDAARLRHVHVHFANNAADIARLATALGTVRDGPEAGWRWTLSMHGPTEFLDPIRFDLAAKIESADVVACISEYCRAAVAALVPSRHHAKLGIVRMSVDAERYRGAAGARMSRADRRLRLLYVGRLVPEKNPLTVVEAVGQLVRAGRSVDCVIVGDGVLGGDVHARVGQLGLTSSVRLLGSVGQDDLPSWYEWADVFCLPSSAEGLPVVIMEAMASELPVVTTPVAAIPELVRDGDTGILVEPASVTALTEAIARLDDDPRFRYFLGRQARRAVVEDHGPSANADRLIELLAPTHVAGVPGRVQRERR